jgi:hypothetical protein
LDTAGGATSIASESPASSGAEGSTNSNSHVRFSCSTIR